MLEIVCENVAAVNNLVGLNVIGEFNNLKGYVFLCKDIFRYFKDFCMRSRRSRNGNAFAFKGIVIYGGVKAVAGVFNNTYNGALILLGNEIRNLLAFKSGKKRFCFIGIFISLFYAENVAVCGRGTFHCKRLFNGVNTCVYGIVGIDYRIVDVFKYVGKLGCFRFFELDIIGVLNNISYGCGNTCIIFKGDKTLLLKKKKRARFVGGVAGNCNGDFAAAAAAGSEYEQRGKKKCCCKNYGNYLFHFDLSFLK